MTVGIEPTVKSFSSVNVMVRFGFGCQNLWVRSVRFEMVLEWCSGSVRFPYLDVISADSLLTFPQLLKRFLLCILF